MAVPRLILGNKSLPVRIFYAYVVVTEVDADVCKLKKFFKFCGAGYHGNMLKLLEKICEKFADKVRLKLNYFYYFDPCWVLFKLGDPLNLFRRILKQI